MNRIRESMENIRASEELKQRTLEYLRHERRYVRAKRIRRYALAVACLCLLIFAGGYTVYLRPVSYISIDVNPSVELGVNRFGRVVEAEAYNEEGKALLAQAALKHKPYLKAIGSLLEEESGSGYLTEDARVFITVISDSWEAILKAIRADELSGKYGAQTYTSDLACRQEAHRQEMSFGKYRAYLELSQYDESLTVEACHGMSMGELEDRIETCKGHQGEEHQKRERKRNRGSHDDLEDDDYGGDEGYDDGEERDYGGEGYDGSEEYDDGEEHDYGGEGYDDGEEYDYDGSEGYDDAEEYDYDSNGDGENHENHEEHHGHSH